MRLCDLIDPKSGDILDEPLVAKFDGPRSFTGEDSLEIYCHGGPYIVRRILETIYANGVRPADPGEFTRRAFLHGKLDLTAAEGVRALVNAESKDQWQAARQLATGKLRNAIDQLRTQLIGSMAYLEAQIDFPDEGDTESLKLQDVTDRVRTVERSVAKLRASYDGGRVAARGLMVALFGAPNTGKSTLMNELLGHERAIVTEVAGTTRDYLEEPCLVEGHLLRLVDMAGIRPSADADAVEQIGIKHALRLAKEADLVLFLAGSDQNAGAAQSLLFWEKELSPRASLKLLTKTDISPRPRWADPSFLAISCKTGAGMDELRRTLARQVETHIGRLGEETYVTTARHAAALDQAQDALARFFAAVTAGSYEEMLAFELQQAARALAAIVGAVDNEDILDTVFSTFCLGK